MPPGGQYAGGFENYHGNIDPEELFRRIFGQNFGGGGGGARPGGGGFNFDMNDFMGDQYQSQVSTGFRTESGIQLMDERVGLG